MITYVFNHLIGGTFLETVTKTKYLQNIQHLRNLSSILLFICASLWMCLKCSFVRTFFSPQKYDKPPTGLCK